MTTTEYASRRDAFSESTPELVAGVIVIVLTILGLANVSPLFLVAVATIVFGVGLLVRGTVAVSEFGRVLGRATGTDDIAGLGSGWATIFLAGMAGIVLGILALLGVASIELVAIAVIGFGAALLISSSASMHLHVAAGMPANPNPLREQLIRESARDKAGLQTMAGLAAIVLGILALSGFTPVTLMLVALLGLGCFTALTSGFLAAALSRAFRAPA